jgi:hypothetical protein
LTCTAKVAQRNNSLGTAHGDHEDHRRCVVYLPRCGLKRFKRHAHHPASCLLPDLQNRRILHVSNAAKQHAIVGYCSNAMLNYRSD